MANVDITMQATGLPHETCTSCDQQFARGDTMSGVKLESGEPAGWFCQKCIDEWRHMPVERSGK